MFTLPEALLCVASLRNVTGVEDTEPPPPKRKAREEFAIKVEDTLSGTDSGSAEHDDGMLVTLDVAHELAQQRGEFNDDEVMGQVSVFMTLRYSQRVCSPSLLACVHVCRLLSPPVTFNTARFAPV